MTTPISFTILLKTSIEQEVFLLSALNVCREILTAKHRSIHCFFLQSEAVYLGLSNIPSSDEHINIVSQWQNFIRDNQIPSFICTNSALRRGIVNQYFADLYHKHNNLDDIFTLATLGTLFTSIENTDRFIEL